jgi:hypothetical protein
VSCQLEVDSTQCLYRVRTRNFVVPDPGHKKRDAKMPLHFYCFLFFQEQVLIVAQFHKENKDSADLKLKEHRIPDPDAKH